MIQTSLREFISDLFSANRPTWLVTSNPADRLATFLLALSFSVWWLAIGVVLQFALGIPNKLRLYVALGIVGPVAVIASVLLIQRLKQSLDIPQDAPFYEPLLAFDSLFILFALLTSVPVIYDVRLALAYVVTFALANGLILWRLVGIYRPALPDARRDRSIRLSLIAASLVTAAVVGSVYASGHLDSRDWYVSAEILFPVSGVLLVILPAALYRHAYRVIPFAAGLAIMLFARRFVVDLGFVLPVSMAAAVVPALLIRPRSDSERPRSFSWLEGLIGVWLALIVVNLYFPADRLHYNAFLAYVNDVNHGKTLLVDTHPQYGLGLLYALTALFSIGILPLSYSAFSLVNSILIVVQGGLLYLMLRTVVKNWWIPALAVTLMAAMFLWQINFVSLYLPSGGPIRFLPIYVLLSVVALRLKFPGRQWGALEYIALAICAGWGFETLVYGGVVYIATRIFEIMAARLTIKETIARVTRLAPPVIAALTIPVVALQVGTYLRSGQWPVWQVYLEILRFYSTDAKPYLLALTFWSEWVFVAVICFASLLLLGLKFFYSSRQEDMKPYILPFGMTVWGIVQFSYFVADPSVITNVAAPSIFLVAYWFAQAHTTRIRADFASLLAYLVYTIVLFELVSAVVLPDPERNATPLALIGRWLIPEAQPADSFDLAARWSAPASVDFFIPPDKPVNSQDGLLAVDLIERYAAGKDRVVALVAPDSSDEALLLTHKVDVFPLGNALIQSPSPTADKLAVEFNHHLADGDIVFIDTVFNNLLPVQVDITMRLCQEFSLHPVEISRSGIAVIRLESSQAVSGACRCGKTRLTCPGSN